MLINNTPLEDHLADHGLLVKREDLSCPPPGPPFSKMRGVYARVKAKYDEGVRVFGALDTFHSQAGHAVAAACAELPGAQCLNFFPVYKADIDAGVNKVNLNGRDVYVSLRDPQRCSQELGAHLIGLPAGRSAILFHSAKRGTEMAGGYMMPNALKLHETVEETAAEVGRTFAADYDVQQKLSRLPWIVAASSGTIAAGVIAGLFEELGSLMPKVIVHLGYDRSEEELRRYITQERGSGLQVPHMDVVNEGYSYADKARPGPTPPWPCNEWYDLKAYRWWMKVGRQQYGNACLWNIG